MFPEDVFIRNLDADSYRENFLVSAVATVFIIRIFLKLTHYPQLAAGSLHIAHIIWGGFFMLAALIILLSFLSKSAANIAAVLGGVGFGTFIDELGKFISSDNDYFFQPTVSIIYIILVLIYLILRFIPRYQKISQKEYLINAFDMIKEAAINDFDIEEEKKAKEYLRKCDSNDPIVQSLTLLLNRIDAEPSPPPGILTRLRILLRKYYYTVAHSGVIANGVIIFLLIQTFRTIVQSVSVFITDTELSFSEWGKLYSSILAGIFVVIGVLALRFSKVEAYRFFRIAILITILLTEFFAFIHAQWYEVVALGANLFILVIINYAMLREKQKKSHEKKTA